MVQEAQAANAEDAVIDAAVAEGGAYDVIRKRLTEQGKQLRQKTQAINAARLEEFGCSEMSLLARVRIRTENNCVARDIVQVGEYLLFGYNVFMGLRKETCVEDVFALFKVSETPAGLEIVPASRAGTFLSEQGFVNDFEELYRYYQQTRLVELKVRDGRLLAAFQIGERRDDCRVFRWDISADGKQVRYIDNRGKQDIQPPSAFDFQWIETTREDSVSGPHAHINILDTLFVQTTDGHLSIRVEDNTEAGERLYHEPVEDKTQSLEDGQIFYASVGSLILLKIRPYREQVWRYLIYNRITREVLRLDAIGQSCIQLPEDHGLIFPGGYYLQSGEHKVFEVEAEGLRFRRAIRSPNGEDVLYIFYEPEAGIAGLFAYNLIEKKLQNPIYCHGYALAEDGRLVVFSAESEPTRVHPMRIWQTAYVSDEFASQTPASQTFLGRIGNSELVSGISDLYSLCRAIDDKTVSTRLYEALSQSASSFFDDHYWVDNDETRDIAEIVRGVAATAELMIDEFEKVESIRQQSARTLLETEQHQEQLLKSIQPENWKVAEEFVDALGELRHQRGHLASIKNHRYIDLARIDQLDAALQDVEASLNEQTALFLSGEKALNPYLQKIDQFNQSVEGADTRSALDLLLAEIEKTASGLDLLSEMMGTLKLADATVRTRITDGIVEVYSKLNQCRAAASHKQKSLGSAEAAAQFGAQFKLFSQSITHALSLATTPEKCDEQLSLLLVQLEGLESQFSDFDEFLTDIIDKREEIYESFESHKQKLLDERQRKAQSVADAADRILSNIEKRSLRFTEVDELNTYFITDGLVLKVRELVDRLRSLDNAVKADDVESRLVSAREQAVRALRDKSEIYESGGDVIKLGPRHRFSVNTQELDLTIIPRGGSLNIHLTGTNYYEPITHPELQALQEYWEMALESETPEVYRAEYLAALMIKAAREGQGDLSWKGLQDSIQDDAALAKMVWAFASPRYKEGYEKGIHDHDAALLLKSLVPAIARADLLQYDPLSRGLAQVFWASITDEQPQGDAKYLSGLSCRTWPERARSAAQMQSLFASSQAIELLCAEVSGALTRFTEQHPIAADKLTIQRAARYLVAELSRETIEFVSSKYAFKLVDQLKESVDATAWQGLQNTLEKMRGWPAERWDVTSAWLQALINEQELTGLAHYIPEAVALINVDGQVDHRLLEVDLELRIGGLLGNHPIIADRALNFALDAWLQRMEHHRLQTVPAYHQYLKVRQEVIASEREALRPETFQPRPLSSFVRNRLINESYLPLIGDNLAKQMGTVGESKRTDLMGLLMMISPPGYGKTTLMEYVASRLGLIFMKINCPALGHGVVSLDPRQAPDATARQELDKLNLALEMGNNVMLYLDDIQHTDPEFLQKFISLCDGTRRIEGVWKGQTRTYDMRGRKFCIVMAGNPYTESGEAFKIPDMLANRADIYNLGDILGGMDEQFALSYIENALTSNPVLAPLATRGMADVYKLVDMARGMDVPVSDLEHAYSSAEVNEILAVLKKLFVVRDVILKVNQAYIASAAQDDRYRTEPAFKLQGSYRNMNKMTEKVSSVMNEAELMQMIADHYLGEAQLLTTGAEDNLLKLATLRGNITKEQAARWQQIKKDFLRNKAIGGDEGNTGNKLVAQLTDLVNSVQALGEVAASGTRDPEPTPAPKVEVINQPVPGLDKVLSVLADTVEQSIFPLAHIMDKKMDIDLRAHYRMKEILEKLQQVEEAIREKSTKRELA